MRLLESIRFWPAIYPGEGFPAVGPIPPLLRHNARERGIGVVSDEEFKAILNNPANDDPILILSPLDFLSRDQALLRANLYIGPTGQELLHIELERSEGSWRVKRIAVELRG
jgi:hypothetical protein